MIKPGSRAARPVTYGGLSGSVKTQSETGWRGLRRKLAQCPRSPSSSPLFDFPTSGHLTFSRRHHSRPASRNGWPGAPVLKGQAVSADSLPPPSAFSRGVIHDVGSTRNCRSREKGRSQVPDRHQAPSEQQLEAGWAGPAQKVPGRAHLCAIRQAERKAEGRISRPWTHASHLEANRRCPLSHRLQPSGQQGCGLANSPVARSPDHSLVPDI